MAKNRDTKPLIKAQTLKGFRDYLSAPMQVREHLMEVARDVFRLYGFSPIETPALEYSEILLGKGGEETDKQLFRFKDQGGRDVALRFDLTVPLARFVSQHYNELVFPFKRYHIGTVWRAENPQRGRFREFMQCDFDVIGTRSKRADVETVLVIHDLFQALGFERFTIRVNHRKVLTGIIESLGLAVDPVPVLRSLDKLEKQGPEKVLAELVKRAELSKSQAEQMLDCVVGLSSLRGDNQKVLSRLREQLQSSSQGLEGLTWLEEIVGVAQAVGAEPRVQIDIAIARGLDYYTGTVYETILDELPEIGSVCSGGRYDNLAELYSRQELPGVGASLGLDRLVAAMAELELLKTQQTVSSVFIPCFSDDYYPAYVTLAKQLREKHFVVEVYPEAIRLGKQLRYAERRGFQIAVIAGDEEFHRDVWQVKDLVERRSSEVASENLVDCLETMKSP